MTSNEEEPRTLEEWLRGLPPKRKNVPEPGDWWVDNHGHYHDGREEARHGVVLGTPEGK